MRMYTILSTKRLSATLIKEAALQQLNITEKEMIRVTPLQSPQVKAEITNWLRTSLPAVFTSANAAEIIIQFVVQIQLAPILSTIYCLSGKTYEIIKQHFNNKKIITADNASELAKKILSDNIPELVFYCGNLRRNELPDTLKENNIKLHEVIVYQTIETETKADGYWDAVLFYSPSGVRSFFAANNLSPQTICFAIGETTAKTISEYTSNKILQSNHPDPENMISELADYFKNLSEHGIKK